MITRIGRYLVYGHFYIAIGAATLTAATYRFIHGVSRIDASMALVFFATLLVYHLDSLLDPTPIGSQRQRRWEHNHRQFRIACITLTAIATLVCLFYIPARLFGLILPLGLISLTYSMPFGLKRIPLLKTFLVAFAWTAVTLGLPWITPHPIPIPIPTPIPTHIPTHITPLHPPTIPTIPTTVAILLTGHRIIFLFVLALMFDTRDRVKDQRAGLFTLPMLWGQYNTKIGAIILLFLAMIPVFLPFANGSQSSYPGYSRLTAAILITSIFTMGLIIATIKFPNIKWIYPLGLDGMIIVYALLLLNG